MKRAVLLALTLSITVLQPLVSQQFPSEIDLLYPEYAQPDQDAAAAIQRRDYRFIGVDRARKVVPGMEHAARLRRRYKVKHLRQRFRLFPTTSERFSFDLRAHAYAEEYNLYLAHYLLEQEKAKK